jgi:dihydropteridine reductase
VSTAASTGRYALWISYFGNLTENEKRRRTYIFKMLCKRGLSLVGQAARRQSTAASAHRCLVVGGCGCLGQAFVQTFEKAGWAVTSVDFAASEDASECVVLESGDSFVDSAEKMTTSLASKPKFHAVVHAAGGWAGSDAGSDDFPASLQAMWEVNVQSAALAAHAGGRFLEPGGMLTLTGAAAAFTPGGTPGMSKFLPKPANHTDS